MKKFINKRNIIIAVAVIAVFLFFRGRANAAKKAAANTTTRIVTVTKKDVVSSLSESGAITAAKTAALHFPSPGKLGFVNVKEGDTVYRGQALMGLDPGDFDAAVTAAYYKYLAADANAKQVEDEVKDHSSDETFAQKNARVSAQTTRDMAYDSWLTAQRARSNIILSAPFAGIATQLTATAVGDTVSVTDGVTVIDPSSLVFQADVDESDIGKVNVNQKILVSLDAFPDEKFDGKITEIGFVSGLSSSGATVFPVKITLTEKPGETFRVGMNGDAEIVLAIVSNVLTVPSEAVVDGQVTLDNAKQDKVKVETGLVGDTDTEIKSGLNEGDKVIIK